MRGKRRVSERVVEDFGFFLGRLELVLEVEKVEDAFLEVFCLGGFAGFAGFFDSDFFFSLRVALDALYFARCCRLFREDEKKNDGRFFNNPSLSSS